MFLWCHVTRVFKNWWLVINVFDCTNLVLRSLGYKVLQSHFYCIRVKERDVACDSIVAYNFNTVVNLCYVFNRSNKIKAVENNVFTYVFVNVMLYVCLDYLNTWEQTISVFYNGVFWPTAITDCKMGIRTIKVFFLLRLFLRNELLCQFVTPSVHSCMPKKSSNRVKQYVVSWKREIINSVLLKSIERQIIGTLNLYPNQQLQDKPIIYLPAK